VLEIPEGHPLLALFSNRKDPAVGRKRDSRDGESAPQVRAYPPAARSQRRITSSRSDFTARALPSGEKAIAPDRNMRPSSTVRQPPLTRSTMRIPRSSRPTARNRPSGEGPPAPTAGAVDVPLGARMSRSVNRPSACVVAIILASGESEGDSHTSGLSGNQQWRRIYNARTVADNCAQAHNSQRDDPHQRAEGRGIPAGILPVPAEPKSAWPSAALGALSEPRTRSIALRHMVYSESRENSTVSSGGST
jgi:hypothetical protein